MILSHVNLIITPVTEIKRVEEKFPPEQRCKWNSLQTSLGCPNFGRLWRCFVVYFSGLDQMRK